MLDIPPTDLTLNIDSNNNLNPTNNMMDTMLNGMHNNTFKFKKLESNISLINMIITVF